MANFEIGKTYFDTGSCDHTCVYTVEVISRTEKTVTYIHNGKKKRRSKIYRNERGEYITPDNYSMAPVFRANRSLEEQQPKVREQPCKPGKVIPFPGLKAEEHDNAEGVTLMLGSKVVANWGTCFPPSHGEVIGFQEEPDRRFTKGGMYAIIRWDDETDDSKAKIDEVHLPGWRSANGSPIGIFLR